MSSHHVFGFTGTREGMTTQQMGHLASLLKHGKVLHHGDCVGADAQAHNIAQGLGYTEIILHPPKHNIWQAFCKGALEILPARPYLERNHDIVDACDTLIAAPKQEQEQQRSGTWATIRYARKVGRRVVILRPS